MHYLVYIVCSAQENWKKMKSISRGKKNVLTHTREYYIATKRNEIFSSQFEGIFRMYHQVRKIRGGKDLYYDPVFMKQQQMPLLITIRLFNDFTSREKCMEYTYRLLISLGGDWVVCVGLGT